MTKSRNDFVSRIRTLKKTINETEAVRSKGPAEKEHNEIARMLRNGLAVVGFACLEDFIKARSSEVLESIGQSGVDFNKLPEKIQNATTHGSISALSYQVGLRSLQDRISFAQDHALKISSTSNSGYDLTPLAFGYGQANLNTESIKVMLQNFSVNNPWGEMKKIASSLGLVALPLEESFKNAALRRHRAAHVSNADTPQSDIDQFVNEAIGIAISYDFLISTALSKIKDLNQAYLSGSTKVTEIDVSYRYIKWSDQKWKELLKNGKKAHRTSLDLAGLAIEAKRRAAVAKQFYVQFDDSGLVVEWCY